MAHDGRANLRPIRTTEEAKARGKLGGIKSGESKRAKKKLSEIYKAFIESAEGQALIDKAIRKGMDKNPTSLLHELRDATEGTKTEVTGGITLRIDSTDNEL